jgi:EutQ-like cupin domain
MDLEAIHGMTLQEIYGPRPVEYLGVWEVNGVEFEDGPTIEIGPGDVGLLEDGASTIWRVHETIRKAYQITYTRPPRW